MKKLGLFLIFISLLMVFEVSKTKANFFAIEGEHFFYSKKREQLDAYKNKVEKTESKTASDTSMTKNRSLPKIRKIKLGLIGLAGIISAIFLFWSLERFIKLKINKDYK